MTSRSALVRTAAENAVPMLPAGQCALAAGHEHRLDQFRRGRLAVRAGDGDDRAFAEAVGQLELAEHRQAGLVQRLRPCGVCGIDAPGESTARSKFAVGCNLGAELDAQAELAQRRPPRSARPCRRSPLSRTVTCAPLVLKKFCRFHAANSQSDEPPPVCRVNPYVLISISTSPAP